MTQSEPIDELVAKILPCPFCGEKEELYPGYRGMGGGTPYQIDCLGCGIEFTPRDGMDAIEAWNRRDALEASEAKAARLTHLLSVRNKQAAATSKFWVRAAKAALAGDVRELRNRVDLAEAEPLDVVLSNGENAT